MINDGILYRVKRPGAGKGTVHLAIGAIYQDGRLQYHDTVHGHNLEGAMEETKAGFTFTKKQEKGAWTFAEMTVDEFNKTVRPKVEDGRYLPKFRSDDDLHEWYRRQFINP